VRRAAEDLVRRLRRWTPASWDRPAGAAAADDPGAPGPGGRAASDAGDPGGRAAVTAAAVQRIADLGADAERRPRRPVPRLADTALADQLAVVVDDVLRAGDPAAVRDLAAELTALRRRLLGRR
jgi:hypothetical protein